IELTAFVFNHKLNIDPKPVYNIYILLNFLFYFIFYKNHFNKTRNKKIANLFIVLHLGLFFGTLFFLKTDFFSKLYSNIIVFSSVLLIIILLLYLVEIINDKRIIFNLKKSFIYWISIGAILFHIGIIPIMITSEYLQFHGLYQYIIIPLNYIMYGCFIIGIIVSDNKTKNYN
ncbi:MAG: hypothetical protein V3U80_06620, partial [Flavobacteriaceae bacterium]